jgi:nitrite reductase/ring-hydroxylating ferredoxin subunit
MVDDERGIGDAAERFDRYLDSLLGTGRPAPGSIGDEDEGVMARMAAELAAAGRDAEGIEPDPAFIEQLRLRMRRADEAIESVRAPRPTRSQPRPGATTRWRLSRRELLQAGLGAAAGVAAGAAGLSLLESRVTPGTADDAAQPLVAGPGFWTEVALVADLPAGSALRFSTVAFDGFVVNDDGAIRALSSTCTHMGCTLRFRPDHRDLRCPCHGASFDFSGRLANGTNGWSTSGSYSDDARPYPISLPDLARPRVKVEDERIWVWTAEV